ncbi:Oidioi.mRNA.OKI2018_I69.PAR.g11469.t1.cds [Oikopleura dioica]|uniref:Oidioi.mRNA.OKI2018_I69.PAR.g11469.t1.cds n=1 Tax=Oikopleura dioica TaxID=34765 RepID=A0ABN7S261_OIKDI|nr:Oidioi.mRNA.OKI2018_I69.PAR.g11469.t1.cds [Oikopleura dioica]
MAAIESFIRGHADLDLKSLKELNLLLAAIEYLSLSIGGLLLIISITGLFASCYQSKLVLSLFAGALTVPILGLSCPQPALPRLIRPSVNVNKIEISS